MKVPPRHVESFVLSASCKIFTRCTGVYHSVRLHHAKFLYKANINHDRVSGAALVFPISLLQPGITMTTYSA
jgi:hypothetical protein